MNKYIYALNFISKVSASLYTGSAVHTSLISHPARIECHKAYGLFEWRHMFKKAALEQGLLAFCSFLCIFVTTYYERKGYCWLGAALLMFSDLPYTLLVLMPYYEALLEQNLDLESKRGKILYKKWNLIHSVRTILGLVTIVLLNI